MPRDKLIEAIKDYIPDEQGNKHLTEIKVYYDKKADAFYTRCPYHLCPDKGGSKEKIGDGPVVVHVMDCTIWEDRPQKVIDELHFIGHIYIFWQFKKRKK